MSLTNMTFLNATANAILAEDATTAMSSARANSTKPDRDRQIKQQPNDGRPSDDRLNEDQCWAAVAERWRSKQGSVLACVAGRSW